MALLVFSDKCKWSMETIEYIKAQPALLEIVRFWNVNTQGVPSKQVTRVPTLVTNEGKMHVGKEVRAWLESMVPCEFESWCNDKLCSNIDGTERETLFELDHYGKSLQPRLTPELESRIAKSVQDAYQEARAT